MIRRLAIAAPLALAAAFFAGRMSAPCPPAPDIWPVSEALPSPSTCADWVKRGRIEYHCEERPYCPDEPLSFFTIDSACAFQASNIDIIENPEGLWP